VSEPATKQDLANELALLRQDLASLATRAELASMRVELVSEIGRATKASEERITLELAKAIAHITKVMEERLGSYVRVVDDKYKDLPDATNALRVDLDDHRSDARIHVRPPRKRARAR
jgi:hypothetical protein